MEWRTGTGDPRISCYTSSNDLLMINLPLRNLDTDFMVSSRKWNLINIKINFIEVSNPLNVSPRNAFQPAQFRRSVFYQKSKEFFLCD